MHDKIFDIAKNNNCIMAITPDNGGTFISSIRKDLIKFNQPRNFYKQFQIWFDFAEASKQIDNRVDFDLEFSFTKIGTVYNSVPSIFYPYSGSNSNGIYFNTTTSQPLRLQCYFFSSSALNVNIVLNQRNDFVIMRRNGQLIIYYNNRVLTQRQAAISWNSAVYPMTSDSVNIHKLTLKIKDKLIFNYPNESEKLGLINKTSNIMTNDSFNSAPIYTYPARIVLPFDFRNRSVLDYSFALRFRFNNLDTYSNALPILSQGFTSTSSFYSRIMSLHGTKISNGLRLNFGTGTGGGVLNTQILLPEQWYDFAISFSSAVGNTMKALTYLNGVFNEQGLAGNTYPNVNPTVDTLINTNAQLFSDPTTLGNRFYKWQLNKFFIFNKSLNREDIISIFN